MWLHSGSRRGGPDMTQQEVTLDLESHFEEIGRLASILDFCKIVFFFFSLTKVWILSYPLLVHAAPFQIVQGLPLAPSYPSCHFPLPSLPCTTFLPSVSLVRSALDTHRSPSPRLVTATCKDRETPSTALSPCTVSAARGMGLRAKSFPSAVLNRRWVTMFCSAASVALNECSVLLFWGGTHHTSKQHKSGIQILKYCEICQPPVCQHLLPILWHRICEENHTNCPSCFF